MVKIQKNSMVLAAVVCLAGQAQASLLDTAKKVVAADLAVCTLQSAQTALKTGTVSARLLPFGIQNEVRPVGLVATTVPHATDVKHELTGEITQIVTHVPAVIVKESASFVGVRVGHATVGVHFSTEGTLAQRILTTEPHVEGVNVKVLAQAGAAYLLATQGLPLAKKALSTVVEKITRK